MTASDGIPEPGSASGGAQAPPPASAVAATLAGQTIIPSAEDVARRVYELFLEDWRRDRERRGRWW
jgi:hypothetical protein